MSGGSESVISLTRILPWTGAIFLVAAAHEFIKLPHHKIKLSVQSFLQVKYRLSIGVLMMVQQSLNLSCDSAISFFRFLSGKS